MKETKSFTIDSRGDLFIDGVEARPAEVSTFDAAFPGRRAKFCEGKADNDASKMRVDADGSIHVGGKTFKLDVDANGNLEFTDLTGTGDGPTTLKARITTAGADPDAQVFRWISNISERSIRFVSLAVIAACAILGIVLSGSSTAGLYVLLVCMASFALLYPRGGS